MTETIKLSDLQPDDRNANKGSERGAYMIRRSLEKLGAGRSILLDKQGRIIAGNKTAESAADIGLDDVILVRTDGKQLVAVMREDLDLDDPAGMARELAYADNRTGQVSLEWDAGVLAEDIAGGVDLSDWWQGFELEELGAIPPDESLADAEPQIDRAEELREKWGVELGQLWRLPSRTPGQEHRLICGDCTDAAVVERVMGGERATLAPVDPPYNVGFDYDGKTVDDTKTIEKYEGFSRAWFGICQSVSERQMVTPGCYNLAWWLRWFEVYHWAAWIKTNSMTNGRVSRFWCWEPVLFFGKHWGKARHSDVFDYPIGQQKDVANHPCPKPLKMWDDILKHYSKPGDIIYEAFNGSGTTIIAAENLARQCRAVEISPGYVAVALERYAEVFGIEPGLVDTVKQL